MLREIRRILAEHSAEAAAAFQAALSHEPIVRLEENLTQEKGGR